MEKWLQGKKTYILAGIALVLATAGWANDYFPDASLVIGVISSLAMTLRAAISKVETKEPAP